MREQSRAVRRHGGWNSEGRDEMKALAWHGKEDIRCDNVPDPKIEEPTDAIVRITATAICGSDLHLYDGYVPFMKPGDVIGHEPMGIVAGIRPDVGPRRS